MLPEMSERMPTEGLEIGGGAVVPLSEVELRTSRSSGPGGQHANVTASRVEAAFDIEASQTLEPSVRARLLERLRQRLADALYVQPPRRATRPGPAARERRLQTKRTQAERKQGRRSPEIE